MLLQPYSGMCSGQVRFVGGTYPVQPSEFTLEMLMQSLGSNLPPSQSVNTVKDVVFPSRVLRRQLDDAEQRLQEMEEELNRIRNREIRDRKRRKKMRVRKE